MDCPYKSRCGVCPGPSQYVSPDGPVPCSVLVIGEAPARMELRYARPFAGDSGAELGDHYLPLANLSRRAVRITNAFRCAKRGFVNPTKSEAAACAARHLCTELRLTQPQVVVTLGAVAAGLFGIGNLDHSHGVPARGSFEHWEGRVFPIFHPAQGIRVPSLITRIRTDFTALGQFLATLDHGDYTPLEDAYPNPDYRLLESPEDLAFILAPQAGDPEHLGIDTESDTVAGMAGAPPWCLTLSPRPGAGYLIPATDTPTLACLNWRLAHTRPLVVLHHALHDIPVSRAMGVEFPRWTCSMQTAYILQDIPMGLKPLAHRLCGMAMQDFEDVVLPHALKVAESYMSDAALAIESRWRYSHTLKSGPRKGVSEIRFKDGIPPFARDAYNHATALLRKLGGDPGGTEASESEGGDEEGEEGDPRKRPWKRWDNWRQEVRDEMVGIMGRPLPRPSITQVPFPKALAYACRDSDAAGRIWPELRKRFRGREARKEIVR